MTDFEAVSNGFTDAWGNFTEFIAVLGLGSFNILLFLLACITVVVLGFLAYKGISYGYEIYSSRKTEITQSN